MCADVFVERRDFKKRMTKSEGSRGSLLKSNTLLFEHLEKIKLISNYQMKG